LKNLPPHPSSINFLLLENPLKFIDALLLSYHFHLKCKKHFQVCLAFLNLKKYSKVLMFFSFFKFLVYFIWCCMNHQLVLQVLTFINFLNLNYCWYFINVFSSIHLWTISNKLRLLNYAYLQANIFEWMKGQFQNRFSFCKL
jgi:hypothetical protein